MHKSYDKAYFDRWYRRGGIGDRARLARKVALAVATAEYHLERPIRTVLDIGAGEGAWFAPLRKLRPDVRCLGFDGSEYAIARYGRTRNLHLARFGDFELLRPCAPADLVVRSPTWHAHLFKRRLGAYPADARHGDLVRLLSKEGQPLGMAYYNPRAEIAARVLSRRDEPIDASWWQARLQQAIDLRRAQ